MKASVRCIVTDDASSNKSVAVSNLECNNVVGTHRLVSIVGRDSTKRTRCYCGSVLIKSALCSGSYTALSVVFITQ